MLAATIDEARESSPDAPGLITDALLLAVAAKTKQPIDALMPALRQQMPAIVEALVSEADRNRSKPTVCCAYWK